MYTKFFLVCSIVLGCLLFAQTTPPAPADQAVKTDEASATVADAPKQAAETKVEPALSEREAMLKGLYDTYWKAMEEDRLDAAYAMYCASYKKEVSLGNFFRAKRSKIADRVFRRIEFHTDECAEVHYYYSMTSGPMDLKNVPARQVWFVEDGEWRLFEKKKARNIGGMGMARPSKIKPPCGKGSESAKKTAAKTETPNK